ncbi:hypothetical protein PRUB_a2362 [Pseudoalteromonas rubra]|uniref:Uncharacterized protein n=1 Tax=Pseudoalteromonas rubra TaxID=43658 RepID=A0A8T0CAR7_9GAMM|nr:hypothetical protein [Pseudoalteromonas rubra]KAF7787854.1 hypothetical protein PRUB_a2362 [Pseudoalteromonas rubra]
MKKLSTVTAACALLLSGQVYAAGATSIGKIDIMYVNNGWTMVHGEKIKGNPSNCSDSTYYAIVPSHPNYDALHSTLLAAKLAGTNVNFYVSGCSGQNNKYPRITSIWVR